MTLLSKLPLPLQQFLVYYKSASDTFWAKFQVVTDSTIVINSVRALVIMLALLMAYVQNSEKSNEVSSVKSSTMMEGKTRSIIDQLK